MEWCPCTDSTKPSDVRQGRTNQGRYLSMLGLRVSISKNSVPCVDTIYGHCHVTCKTRSPGHNMSGETFILETTYLMNDIVSGATKIHSWYFGQDNFSRKLLFCFIKFVLKELRIMVCEPNLK